MSMNPYNEEKNNNIIRRTFANSVVENELVWHRDKSDRVVIVVENSEWAFQFDNQLPFKLNIGEEIFIPKNTFHRVIKGSGDLVVEIIETEFDDDVLAEAKKKTKKKDACYHKVRSRYDVWPSAYASGALVKCRKVGAANWGNKTDESVDVVDEKWSKEYKKSIDCNNPKGFSQKAHCDRRKKRQKGEETKSKSPFDEGLEVYEGKTDFSKEKKQGLHGWFARQGGSGKDKGWVDCNTCRKDPKTGRKKCKSCGRKEGEKRAKYPDCRPTPSACSTPGRGKKWGKRNDESLSPNEKNSIFESNIKNMILEGLKNLEENTKVLPETKPKTSPDIVKQPRRKKIWEVKPAAKPKPKM